MTYSPYHQRRSIRLKGYDYSLPGAYFVTICTFERQPLFGEVVNGNLQLNQLGRTAQVCWLALSNHFPYIGLDVSVVMPNHIHGVLWIHDVGARHAVPLPPKRFGKSVAGSLATVVRSYKSAVTRRIGQMRHTLGVPVWQRNYYEHIIRNDLELDRIRVYIQDNPAKWQEDGDNPLNHS